MKKTEEIALMMEKEKVRSFNDVVSFFEDYVELKDEKKYEINRVVYDEYNYDYEDLRMRALLGMSNDEECINFNVKTMSRDVFDSVMLNAKNFHQIMKKIDLNVNFKDFMHEIIQREITSPGIEFQRFDGEIFSESYFEHFKQESKKLKDLNVSKKFYHYLDNNIRNEKEAFQHLVKLFNHQKIEDNLLNWCLDNKDSYISQMMQYICVTQVFRRPLMKESEKIWNYLKDNYDITSIKPYEQLIEKKLNNNMIENHENYFTVKTRVISDTLIKASVSMINSLIEEENFFIKKTDFKPFVDNRGYKTIIFFEESNIHRKDFYLAAIKDIIEVNPLNEEALRTCVKLIVDKHLIMNQLDIDMKNESKVIKKI